MIKVYITHSCKTCRMVISWLTENNVKFITRNIFASIVSHSELKEILKLSEEGFDSIVSKNSKIYKQQEEGFLDDMTIKEASEFIIKNPSILRRPIMIDTTRGNLVVGFNKDAIRVLLPKIKGLDDIPDDEDRDDYEVPELMQEEIEKVIQESLDNNINKTQTISKKELFIKDREED